MGKLNPMMAVMGGGIKITVYGFSNEGAVTDGLKFSI